MAVNPANPVHRQRLARAVDFSYTHLKKYNLLRAETVQAYLGYADGHSGVGHRYNRPMVKGNLLQKAGLNLQVALAYGEPQFTVTARVPEQRGFAEKLGVALNRMSALLNLGEIARNVAADSYFGYGIYKCGVGMLPESAQQATGQIEGPCVWRVSQQDFLFDITAQKWDDISYVGDMYRMPLNEAQELYPHAADRLEGFVDHDRMDGDHVMPRSTRHHSAEDTIWLVDFYFPGSRTVATWPVRTTSFNEIDAEPLVIREYNGHWSGVYQVLNHLYAPDDIVPVAQAESVKAIHFLFNDLMDLTSEQALEAKINPIVQQGSEKDMIRIQQATDRKPVSVQNLQHFGAFEVPGPTQSQTAYTAALYNFFEEFSPATDEPARAPTATQGALERQSTNAVIGEARRKFNRALQLVGYKLGHLLMNDQALVLPASVPLRPGSQIPVDMTWTPNTIQPRPGKIDDYEINIEPHSTIFRTPQEKLQQLFGANAQIAALMQLQAQGAPINVERAIEIIAEYSGLPEIRELYEEADPLYQAKSQAGQGSVPRLGTGQYVRHNVSEKTNEGALVQNLTQGGGGEDTAGGVRFE